jgi:phenylpyruvate tautomerase PptA (4-oxalocrotonate tautomerase family)
VPSTRIETSAGWINGRHAEVIAAVQRALVEGIRIPPEDRHVRILEYPPGAMAVPEDRGPRSTFIEISMFAGRSVEAKRRLYAALQREMAAFGLGPRDLKVLVHDEPRENWSVGGVALSDVEIGFKIDV